MTDKRSRAQRWADVVTEFSGSWPFIIWFAILSTIWVLFNVSHIVAFDPYPFLFLNWILTVISTFQNPLIMLSQNRQNEVDRDHIADLHEKLDKVLAKLKELEEK